MQKLETMSRSTAGLKAQDEPVAYLITWHNGNKKASLDKCHGDDGTYESLYLCPDPRVAKYRKLLRQAAVACECVPKGVRNGDHISLPGRIRVALEKP